MITSHKMEKKRFDINLDDPHFTKERTPMRPLFQSSARQGDNVSPASSANPKPPQIPTLSYAEFVVQNSRDVAAPHSRSPSQHDEPTPHNNPAPTSSGVNEPAGTDRMQDADQRTESLPATTTKPVGSGNSIIVSPRQRGNPILKFVRSVPWEFGDIIPDYVLGQMTCALFLSLRYHNLNPDYIHDRLKKLRQTFTLRVLLVQVDMKEPHHSLKELARMCILADCTLILAWSPEEAGRYLETYKAYEKKPADLLKEHVEKDYLSKVTDCLTTVKSINKTDSITLLSTFSSVKGIINASKEDLILCPGLGPQKARRLHDVLHQPFLKSKRKDSQ